jgi:RNA polymerase-binding transcription factor DksA
MHLTTLSMANKEETKTRYSDNELKEFEAIIDKKLEDSIKQLDYYRKQLQEMADNPDTKVKGLDDGIGTVEAERISSLAARVKKYVHHLENAKIRIKNKVYGICRQSGKLISKERLRAVPHATLSIVAKQGESKRRR